MRRKFSFDIPRLKVGPTRPEGNNNKSRASPPDSSSSPTTPVPKSLRQLPSDLDAELRAACTWVVENYRPSHEIWTEDTKPALAYAAIQGGLDAMLAGRPGACDSTDLYESAAAVAGQGKYSYRPDVAMEDLFKNEERGALAPAARQRAEHVKAPPPPPRPNTQQQRSMTVITHAESPPQLSAPPSKPTSAQSNVSELRIEPLERAARTSARSDSIGTTGSTPHTESTDYPWNVSTAITSTAITPARGSKRTSSQAVHASVELGGAPRSDAANAEWMRARMEKHTRLNEEKEKTLSKDTTMVDDVQHPFSATDAVAPSYAPMSGTMARVPTRKPLPASRSESHLAAEDESSPRTREEAQDGAQDRAGSAHQEARSQGELEARGRDRSRSHSKFGRASRAASSGKGRAASRAASRAENVAQESLEQHACPASTQSEVPQENAEIRSRTASFTQQVKEYFRPGSVLGSQRPSADLVRGRAESVESAQSNISHVGRSDSASRHRWRPWRSRTPSNFAGPEYGYFDSATDLSERRCTDAAEPTVSPNDKPVINLNRELPPLPSLDQWKPEQPEPVQQLLPKPSTRLAAVVKASQEVSMRQHRRADHSAPISPVEVTGHNPATTLRPSRSNDISSHRSNGHHKHSHHSLEGLKHSQTIDTGTVRDMAHAEKANNPRPLDSQHRVDTLRKTAAPVARQSPPSIRHVHAATGGRTHIASLSNSPIGHRRVGSAIPQDNKAPLESSARNGRWRANSSHAESPHKYSMDDEYRQPSKWDHQLGAQNKNHQAPPSPAQPKDNKERRRWWGGKDKRPRGESQGAVQTDAPAEAPVIRRY